ncbi:MAG: CBS domain-containing protein [Hyphomicrobiales bacterium]|nr:CBS domain-containing protein [Hyphomicrobiales bacterium]
MNQRPRIRDYMATDIVTVSPDMEILRAMELLLERRFSGAPVVDEGGRLVGVLSKKDCLRAALNGSYHQEWGGVVADYMSKSVETLDANLDLVSAAERFLTTHYRRFPVMEDGRMVGQISRADLLRALVEQWR